MKLTSLLQLVDKLHEASRIDNLQQVDSIFGYVSFSNCLAPDDLVISGEHGSLIC